MRLPSPPVSYDRQWGNQYTRVLEQEAAQTGSAIQTLGQFIPPSYTTTDKNLLINRRGQIIFDTDLGKLCVNTGAGWETITSA